MPRLAMVIPALGRLDRLEATLLSVLENRPQNCEVLVVHRGDYVDQYDLADEVAFIEAPAHATLATCLAAADDRIRAPILHLLAPGVLVADGWCEAPLGHFRRSDVASVSPVVLDLADERRVLTCGVGYHAEGVRSRLCHGLDASLVVQPPRGLLGPSRLAGFYRRDVQGGLSFDERMGDEFADVDLALRLKARGYRCAWEPACPLRADADADAAEPTCERGRAAERLFWRHAPVFGRPRSMALHALAVLGEFGQACVRPKMFTQLWGRALGAIERTPKPEFVAIEAATNEAEANDVDARDERPARDTQRRIDGAHGAATKSATRDGASMRKNA